MKLFSKFGAMLVLLAALPLTACSQPSDLETENQRLADELQELRDKVDALGEQDEAPQAATEKSSYALDDFLSSFQGSWSYDSETSFATWTFNGDGSAVYETGIYQSEGAYYEGAITSVSRSNGVVALTLTMTGGAYNPTTTDWEVIIDYDGSESPASFSAENITWGSDAKYFTPGIINHLADQEVAEAPQLISVWDRDDYTVVLYAFDGLTWGESMAQFAKAQASAIGIENTYVDDSSRYTFTITAEQLFYLLNGDYNADTPDLFVTGESSGTYKFDYAFAQYLLPDYMEMMNPELGGVYYDGNGYIRLVISQYMG